MSPSRRWLDRAGMLPFAAGLALLAGCAHAGRVKKAGAGEESLPAAGAAQIVRAAPVAADATVAELQQSALSALAGRDWSGAAGLLARAIEKEPRNAELQFASGWAAEQLQRPEQAAAAYRRALEAEPGHLGAALNLARVHRNGERLAEAESVLRQALARHDGDPALLAALAAVLRLERRFDEAEAAVRKALGRHPDDAGSYKVLALIDLDRGRLRLAALELAEARRLDPADPGVVNTQGLLALRREEPSAARARFEEALALDPGFLPALANLGAVALSFRDYRVAADAYARATAADPSRWELLLALGWSLEGLKRPAEARAAFEKVLVYRPGQDEALFGQAVALKAEGDLARARERLQAYVKLPQASRTKEAQGLLGQLELRIKNPAQSALREGRTSGAPEAGGKGVAKRDAGAGADISQLQLPPGAEAGGPSSNLPQDLPPQGAEEPAPVAPVGSPGSTRPGQEK